MKTSKLLLLAILAVLVALPAAAQVNDTYVIPAAAHLRGGFGSNWMTSFSVFNPHFDYDLVISITYLPTGGATGREELVRVPPNSVAYSDNLLLDLFGITGGSGTLLVATFAEDNPGVPNDVLSRSFLVITDTYNNLASGTYGQTVPGTWTGLLNFATDKIQAVAHGIMNSDRLGWRTNIGAANLGRCSVTMRVTAYDADGRVVLDRQRFILPPLGHMQDRLPVQLDAGSIEFYIEDPCANDAQRYAVVFPYVSTIDQLSGDPRYQSPTLLAAPGILVPNGVASQSTIAAMRADPTTIGKKIDSTYARGVRSEAIRGGEATLRRTAKGWKIER